MRDWREVISPEEMERIFNETERGINEAIDMMDDWGDQHLSVPEVKGMGEILKERSTNAIVIVGPWGACEILKEALCAAFVAGYNRGLTQKPLIQIKGLCDHDHSGN